MCCIKNGMSSLFIIGSGGQVPVCLQLDSFQQREGFDLFGLKYLKYNGRRVRTSHCFVPLSILRVNLRNYSTVWIFIFTSSPALQLVAKCIGLTQSSLVILTWLFLFIKLHNPVGSFFLPVWDTVYRKKPQSLHNCIARKSKCFLVESKRPTPWLLSYSSLITSALWGHFLLARECALKFYYIH